MATGSSIVACGSARSDDARPLGERLVTLHDELVRVVDAFRPDEAAVEQTFVNKNAAATLKLGQARGIALVVPAKAGVLVAEYAPNLVKKTIVGAGHGDKAQIRMMLGVLLPKAAPKSHDAADALAIAITHAHHRQSAVLRAVARSGEAGEGCSTNAGRRMPRRRDAGGELATHGADDRQAQGHDRQLRRGFRHPRRPRRRLSGALLVAHPAGAAGRSASRASSRSRPMCARTRSGCSGFSPRPSANGSACCRPCRASAPRWRSRSFRP